MEAQAERLSNALRVLVPAPGRAAAVVQAPPLTSSRPPLAANPTSFPLPVGVGVARAGTLAVAAAGRRREEEETGYDGMLVDPRKEPGGGEGREGTGKEGKKDLKSESNRVVIRRRISLLVTIYFLFS